MATNAEKNRARAVQGVERQEKARICSVLTIPQHEHAGGEGQSTACSQTELLML
jgi:hypothetical protein